MDEQYFVATDGAGVEHREDVELHWSLAADGSASLASGGPVLLYAPGALLDVLDDVVLVATPRGRTTPAGEGILETPGATLQRCAAWDVRAAATFALDCADHALGEAAAIELPGGVRLDEVILDARAFLRDADEPAEGRLARLARLATARRLHRTGERVGDAAMGVLTEDLANELDATTDPAWTLLASVADAVLAAVEALRHLALPRYAASREELADAQSADADERRVPDVLVTAWGPIAVGAEHESTYLPAALLARESAFRARETANERGGDAAGAAERAWQAERLSQLLAGSS